MMHTRHELAVPPPEISICYGLTSHHFRPAPFPILMNPPPLPPCSINLSRKKPHLLCGYPPAPPWVPIKPTAPKTRSGSSKKAPKPGPTTKIREKAEKMHPNKQKVCNTRPHLKRLCEHPSDPLRTFPDRGKPEGGGWRGKFMPDAHNLVPAFIYFFFRPIFTTPKQILANFASHFLQSASRFGSSQGRFDNPAFLFIFRASFKYSGAPSL